MGALASKFRNSEPVMAFPPARDHNKENYDQFMINLHKIISDSGYMYLEQNLGNTSCGMVVYNEEKFVTFFLDGNENNGADSIKFRGGTRWKGEESGVIKLNELMDNIKKVL